MLKSAHNFLKNLIGRLGPAYILEAGWPKSYLEHYGSEELSTTYNLK